MKNYLLLLLGSSILSSNMALAQPGGVPPGMSPPEGYVLVKATNSLTKFDLDFPGGTPKDLVKAIEKATDKPLNAVIPDEYADSRICAITVKNVTIPQVFEVLKLASRKNERYLVYSPDKNFGGEERVSMYGFNTTGVSDGNSIWYFYREGEPGAYQTISTTACRFYQLSPYLDAGYKVEDITTAIDTAWKMLGVAKLPKVSFHKDTKVLIAVGDADKVNLIGDVLKQLSTTPKEKSNGKDLPKSKDP